MTNAYEMTKRGVSVYKASRLCGVPESTLRDRTRQNVSIDCTRSGPGPVLGMEEEAKLCQHLKDLAAVGYGYTRAEVINLASDYAISLGKRTTDHPLTKKWFYGFMDRWPELKVNRPSSLSEQRAKCTNEESVTKYFTELARIMNKYDLTDKPQNIYNIDEKGINTEYRPPSVVSGTECKPQAIMAERSKTVTLIGAGNAAGHQIPPFFVFPGVRMVDGLLEGKSPGTDGVMTPSGWSNGEVFKQYLQNHFIKYCQGRSEEDTVLLLYDGHRSHVSVDLIEWARDHNIVLFVLPPHTSHILQPMDVGCFGPLQIKYSQECTKFARLHHRVVTRYDVCSLACKAYLSALSPCNLSSSFQKSGIFPLQKGTDMVERLRSKLAPSTLYSNVNEEGNESKQTKEDNVEPQQTKNEKETEQIKNRTHDPETFFEDRNCKVVKKVVQNKRRNISDIIGGKALEGETETKMRAFVSCTPSKKVKKDGKKKTATIKMKQIPSTVTLHSPEPGPSHINLAAEDSQSDTESEIDEESKCCVCKRFYVQQRDNIYTCELVQWVQCDKCMHWVHLKYCTPLRVARKNTEFICNCCK